MGLIPSKEDQQGVMVITVSAVFEALAMVAVALRIWSRRLKKKALDGNDYIIVVALLFSIALVAVIVIAVVAGGLGQHTADLVSEPDKLVVFGKCLVAVSPIWVSVITAVKMSILDLYIKIFRSTPFRICCYVAMGICALFWLYDILVALLICQPLAFNWDPATVGGHCGNVTVAYITAHAINFAIDVSLALLPMPILWRLRMPTRKKVEISIMFSLGTLICIISVLRIVFFKRLNNKDPTHSIVLLYIFTALEPLLGIVLASLPVMQPAGTEVVNSSAFSWAKSLLGTLGRGSKYRKEKGSSSNIPSKYSEAWNLNHINDSCSIKAGQDVEGHSMDDLELPIDHTARNTKISHPDAINVINTWDVHSNY